MTHAAFTAVVIVIIHRIVLIRFRCGCTNNVHIRLAILTLKVVMTESTFTGNFVTHRFTHQFIIVITHHRVLGRFNRWVLNNRGDGIVQCHCRVWRWLVKVVYIAGAQGYCGIGQLQHSHGHGSGDMMMLTLHAWGHHGSRWIWCSMMMVVVMVAIRYIDCVHRHWMHVMTPGGINYGDRRIVLRRTWGRARSIYSWRHAVTCNTCTRAGTTLIPHCFIWRVQIWLSPGRGGSKWNIIVTIWRQQILIRRWHQPSSRALLMVLLLCCIHHWVVIVMIVMHSLLMMMRMWMLMMWKLPVKIILHVGSWRPTTIHVWR